MALRLYELRKINNMSQREVAEAIGCSPVVYSRYETGAREPSIDVLIRLSSVFRVSVDYIIGNTTIEASALSDYEIALVEASRRTTSYVREDVLDFCR